MRGGLHVLVIRHLGWLSGHHMEAEATLRTSVRGAPFSFADDEGHQFSSHRCPCLYGRPQYSVMSPFLHRKVATRSPYRIIVALIGAGAAGCLAMKLTRRWRHGAAAVPGAEASSAARPPSA